ncbi:hypothetical protein NBRC110019_06660 [Neptunitalea chrysea]|uniref:DUF4129 domain-containing protein n=1 Tax=Neptunitalea chrysea TaxID=1647581 RepID=A0A9W6B5D1_9FLAO|nr:hypothetical protein [Neptunitalea chrysea]GLB51627.1 hypothetical protein NBRC110019_06660 [Neptunitalea chrysea]
MIKKLLLFILLVLVQFTTEAQETVPPVEIDSAKIEVQSFSENLQEKYNDSDFDYTSNDTGDVNLMRNIFKKLFGWTEDLFGIELDFMTRKILEYIVYVLFICLLVYLIIKYLINAPINTVFKKESRTIDTLQFDEENIEKIDFDILINQALSTLNYRLAVRYLYLKSLQLLAAKNMIEWHYDKTNSEYQNEIKNPETKEIFKSVSYIYDYVWYGEFSIDEKDFAKTQSNFNQLNKLVANG